MPRDLITEEFLNLCRLYNINPRIIVENVPGQSVRTAERWFFDDSFNVSPMALAWLKLFIEIKGLQILNGNNGTYSTVNINNHLYYPAEYIADICNMRKETLLKNVSSGKFVENVHYIKHGKKTFFTDYFLKDFNK